MGNFFFMGGKKSDSQLHICEFFLPPLSLFKSLVFPHVSPHLLILKLCSVITWDGGGFMVRLALCSFPSFLLYLARMQITVMLEEHILLQVICSLVLC